jgi:hypothetical protein
MKEGVKLYAQQINHGQSEIWLGADDKELTQRRRLATSEVNNVRLTRSDSAGAQFTNRSPSHLSQGARQAAIYVAGWSTSSGQPRRPSFVARIGAGGGLEPPSLLIGNDNLTIRLQSLDWGSYTPWPRSNVAPHHPCFAVSGFLERSTVFTFGCTVLRGA